MDDIEYKIRLDSNTKTKKVRGLGITPHFAVRFEGELGWRITHLPSGYLLGDMGFPSPQEAQIFARGIEQVYGQNLDDANQALLLTLSHTSPKLKKMYDLLQKINKVGIITMQEIKEIWK